MVELIRTVNGAVNDFIWGVPAMVCILGVGLLLSVRTRFLQIRKFPYAIRTTLGRMFRKKDAADGAMTPFQAVCTALAATVGTGNIAGVAGAIAIGGPGAVFWMWCSALLGMCTKFSEVTLALHFRERSAGGNWTGGPMYYIKNGLGKRWQWLAALYSLFGVLTVFGTGNATQVNTIVTSIDAALLQYGLAGEGALPMLNLIVGVFVAMLVALVLLGGIKRIGSVTEKLVPVMAAVYIIACLVVVFANVTDIPRVFGMIFKGAFTPEAVTGGAVGISIKLCVTWGVKRGVFSNEAGLGSAPIAHAASSEPNPVKQGLYGIFEVFMDTIVICTLTGLTLLLTADSIGISYGTDPGTALNAQALGTVFGSRIGALIIAIGLSLFALSTVLSWGLYGTRCWEFIFGTKAIKPYQIIFTLIVIVGATMSLDLAWNIADTLNGLMAIPNLIGVLALSGVVVKSTREFFSKDKELRS